MAVLFGRRSKFQHNISSTQTAIEFFDDMIEKAFQHNISSTQTPLTHSLYMPETNCFNTTLVLLKREK